MSPREAREASAPVSGWDLIAGEYGPGTRLVLFTAGCPLRCVYCRTPGAWSDGGRWAGVEHVLDQVHRYRPLFDLTGGGVTLSGGEPLLHIPFTTALVRAVRADGVHCALATSGIGGERLDDVTISQLDLVLLDLKAHDLEAFQVTTGSSSGPALGFAERVAAAGRPIRVKVVVVPGLTDGRANIRGLAAFLAGLGTVERVDVVPFDRTAQFAWGAAGLEFPLAQHPGPTREALGAVRNVLAERGLGVG